MSNNTTCLIVSAVSVTYNDEYIRLCVFIVLLPFAVGLTGIVMIIEVNKYDESGSVSEREFVFSVGIVVSCFFSR
jgi:hypothetical protein